MKPADLPVLCQAVASAVAGQLPGEVRFTLVLTMPVDSANNASVMASSLPSREVSTTLDAMSDLVRGGALPMAMPQGRPS